MDRLGCNLAQMFPAGIGAASAALSFHRSTTNCPDRRQRRPNNWDVTVFTLYTAAMVFCAVAILVVFELINRR